MAEFTPATELERFLQDHGNAAPFHPEFYTQIRSGELLVLGQREDLATGGFGISLDVEYSNQRPIVFIFSSLSALKTSMDLRKISVAKFARLPGADILTMLGKGILIKINHGLMNQVAIDI